MARKKEARKVIKAEPVAGPAADGVDDLEILNPERPVTIAGRDLVLREYGFIEGLRLAELYAPFVDDLYEQLAAGGVVPTLDEIVDLIGRHHTDIVKLVAISADVEEAWVMGLSDRDGMNLLYVWWVVNSHFFMRRVLDRLAAQRALARAVAGATSTPSSSSTDTGPAT